MNVIKAINISKSFGNAVVVKDVSFQVESGKIFGLLGPNGAGKTTILRMINDIISPDSGTIIINGTETGKQARERIGYLPEERGLYKKMKVGEQLEYLARLKGLGARDARSRIAYWMDRFNATEWMGKQVGELSKGMSQKIQFISTIVHDPEICIFDEPFSGLDPINSELLKEVILELKDMGRAILFSTHRMEQVEQMCDDICLLNNGRAVLAGNLREIKKTFGKNTILIEFLGSKNFLDQLENIRINNRSSNFAEIRLLNGQSPQQILKRAMETVDVHKFEIVEPSLVDIFISTVGDDNVTASELK